MKIHALLGSMLLVSAAQGATLVVANKADATASLLELTSGQVVITLTTTPAQPNKE